MKTTVVGGYPKILENQLLRKTLWEIDRKGKSVNGKLEEVVQTVTRSAIREQEEAGLDVISDGGIRWQDEVTPPLGGLDGLRITGLLRYFNTNVLYRQPVIAGPVKLKAPTLVRDYTFASGESKKPVKPILTGPFTIGRSSRDEHYKDPDKMVMALAQALAGEVQALEKAGAAQIQINEPYLLSEPSAFDLFKRAFETLTRGISAEVTLYFSFGDFSKVFPKILDMDVARIGFDLTTTPNTAKIMADQAFKGRRFLAGLMDARNTQLETADEVFRMLETLTTHISPADLEVSPSANLEFLPLDRCRAKLKNIVTLVTRFKEGKK